MDSAPPPPAPDHPRPRFIRPHFIRPWIARPWIARPWIMVGLVAAVGLGVGGGVRGLVAPALERLETTPQETAAVRALAELTDSLARFAAGTAYLEGAATADRLQNLHSSLRQQAQTIGILVGELTVHGLNRDQTEPLRRLASRLTGDMDELNHAVAARLAVEADLRQALERLMERHAAFRGTLNSLTEEGLRALPLASPAESAAAAADLLRSRDALEALDEAIVAHLFTAGSLLMPPSRLDDREATFRREARALTERLDQLPIGTATTRRTEAARLLVALGLDTGNIFDQQRELSRQREAAAAQTRSFRDRIGDALQVVLRLTRSHSDTLARQSRRAYDRLILLPLLAGAGGTLAMLLALGRPGTRAMAAPPTPPPATDDTAPLRILLAEDEPINQMVAAAMLRREGHSVTVVGDGNEAVSAIGQAPAEARFDLAILDLRMPNLDGLGAVRAIRSLNDPALARLPVAILTASIVPEDADACRAAGADEVVAKPLRPGALGPLLSRLRRTAPPPIPATASETGGRVDDAPDAGFSDQSIRQMRDALPPARVAALIDGTLATLNDYADTLRRSWGAGDLPKVSAMAHKIAGVAGVYGCLALRGAAQAVELAIERRDTDPVPLLAALDAALPPALAALATERRRLDGKG